MARSEFGSMPLCACRGAQRQADQGIARCLSRRRVCAGPRLNASTAGCPQRSGGTRTVGSPFLCLLSFGEAKESESPAGANSRLQPRHKSNSTSAQCPHPDPPRRGRGARPPHLPRAPLHQNKGKSQSTGSMPTPALVLTGRRRWVQSPIEIHHPGETDDHAPAPPPAMRSPRDRTPVRRLLRPDQGSDLRPPGHARAAALLMDQRRDRKGHRLQDQLAHVRRRRRRHQARWPRATCRSARSAPARSTAAASQGLDMQADLDPRTTSATPRRWSRATAQASTAWPT